MPVGSWLGEERGAGKGACLMSGRTGDCVCHGQPFPEVHQGCERTPAHDTGACSPKKCVSVAPCAPHSRYSTHQWQRHRLRPVHGDQVQVLRRRGWAQSARTTTATAPGRGARPRSWWSYCCSSSRWCPCCRHHGTQRAPLTHIHTQNVQRAHAQRQGAAARVGATT